MSDEIVTCEWCGKEIYKSSGKFAGVYYFCSNRCISEYEKQNPGVLKKSRKMARWAILGIIVLLILYSLGK